MNDGVVDPAGRFVAGSMAYDLNPGGGSLYSRAVNGEVQVLLDDVTISNGIDWSDDGRIMFYVDSPTGRVDLFDYDAATGAITNRRPFVTVDGGTPDGICLDVDGGLWVALWDGSSVVRFDASGRRTHVVEVGVPQVTACAFGGPDLDRLFVTTAALNQPEGGLDGSVFVCEPGFTGRPAGVIPEKR